MDRPRAERFADRWYAAWNAHDLEGILEHYTDDVEMTSPMVAKLTGDPSGRITGKDALGRFFTAALERFPELHFEPVELTVGVDSLVMHYRSVNGITAEVVVLDERDHVVRYSGHYAPERG